MSKMTTRSQASNPPSNPPSEGSMDTASGEQVLSQAEVETFHRRILEKERMLRDQTTVLKRKQEEMEQTQERLDRIRRDFEQRQPLGDSLITARLTQMEQAISTLVNALPEQLGAMSQRITDLNERFPFDTHRDEETPIPRPRGPRSPSEPPTSPIRLKDVIDTIPKYDGHKMSVFYFCKMCERALKLIPANQEYHLVQLILNKLQGHAYAAIEGSENTTVHELTKRLRRIFGPNKSTDQYRGELANVYMKPNENLFDYIERVKELQTAILDGESTERGFIDSSHRAAIEYTTMESFVNGLPSDLLIRVKLEKCYTLEGTIMTTIQLSKQLEAESLRKKERTYNHPFRADAPQNRGTPLNNASKNVSFQGTPMTSANTSQRTGAGPSPFIRPLIPGRPGPNTPSNVCFYCKAPGHFMNECQKLAYRKSMEAAANTGATPSSGNAQSVPGTSGVHRDATPPGRPITSILTTRKPVSQTPPLPTLPE
jgi:hypothetical protein